MDSAVPPTGVRLASTLNFCWSTIFPSQHPCAKQGFCTCVFYSDFFRYPFPLCKISISIPPITYHVYCPGRNDNHIFSLVYIPASDWSLRDYTSTMYWISTMISNSTVPLTTPLFHRNTLFSLGLEPSPIIQDPLYVTLWTNLLHLHSVYVILPIFYSFESPNSIVTRLGLFPLSYSIAHLL